MAARIRFPELSVRLNGLLLFGVIGAEIHSTNHFAADRFQIRAAARAVSQTLLHIPNQRVEIKLTLNGVTGSVIQGTADCVSLDPITGVTTLEGRDLSSALIEAQTNATFPNQTASEIAQLLAARHGLGASVEQTTTPVGRYYQSEHDRVTLGQFAKTTTEWDLLANLATREGFDLYMDGDVLCFQRPRVEPAIMLRSEDCLDLRLEHSIPLSRPVEVTVKSWNSKTGSAAVAVAKQNGIGQPLKRTMSKPNLSVAEAQKLADRTIDDMRRHQWLASATFPGETSLSSRSHVNIVDTGTPWDRSYRVMRVSRHIDSQRGFIQRLALQGM